MERKIGSNDKLGHKPDEWESRADEIGEMADRLGVSLDEAARRLGIKNPDEEDNFRIIKKYLSPGPQESRTSADKEAGFFCAECAETIEPGKSCSHVSVGGDGKVHLGEGPGFSY